MSKADSRARNAAGAAPDPAAHRSQRPSLSTYFGPLLVGGVAVVAVFGYLNLLEMRSIHRVLDGRLDQVDGRLVELTKKVEQAATRPAAAPRSGPDPDHVYIINTDGAPAEGPPGAAITIAEFSDFQ